MVYYTVMHYHGQMMQSSSYWTPTGKSNTARPLTVETTLVLVQRKHE